MPTRITARILVPIFAFIALVLVIGGVMAFRAGRHASGQPNPAAPPASSNSALTPVSASTQTQSSAPRLVGSDAMADAFRKAKLPSPLSNPDGDPDQAAAALARRVVAADDQSTAALLTAIRMSGIGVRGDNGSLALQSVKQGQGIYFDAWEVAAMAKLFGEGMQVKLVDLSQALSTTLPPFKGVAASLFVDGIQAAAQGNQPARRFWGRFIVELGRQSAQPYDLLAPQLDPATVNLDAVQALLILQRLTADITIRGGGKKATKAGLSSGESFANGQASLNPAQCRSSVERPTLHDAVWHGPRHPRLVRIAEGDNNLPCTLSELLSQLLDASAYAQGTAFDKILEFLEEHGGGAGVANFSKGSSVANALLAIIKLIAYYACLETDVTLSGQPPLVRTKSPYPANAGETRTITGKVRENIGNWQAVNCLRALLNAAGAAGIDFSLPNDGPVEGAEFQWILVRGGVSVNHAAGAQSYFVDQPFVRFVGNDGTPRIQSAVGVLAQNLTAPKTDKDGKATIDLQGTEQKPPLQGNVVPMHKEAEVRFTVAPKPMSMSQDTIDALGTGLGGVVGNFIGFPVEVMLRSNIHLSKALVVPVKDWQGCDGGWGGTVDYTRTTHYIETASGTGEITTYAINATEHLEASLRGDPNFGMSGVSHGQASGNSDRSELDTLHTAMGDVPTQRTDNLSGSGNVDFSIRSLGQNTYEIQMLGSVTFTGQHTEVSSGYVQRQDTASVVGIPQFRATAADPNHPDSLQGDSTVPDPSVPNGQIEISWDLAMCK